MKAGYQQFVDYDHGLEAAVLGVFLLEPSSFGATYNLLTEDCFHSQYHLQTYQVLKSLFDKSYPVDLVTVTREYYDRKILDVDGYPTAYYLTNMMVNVVSSAHLDIWCIKLRELAARRLMVAVTSSGFEDGDVLDGASEIEKKLKKILDVRVSDDWSDSSQVAIKLSKRMEQVGDVAGIPSPFDTLNRLNGGFRPGNVVVLGARPGVGKSALGGQVGIHAAKLGFKVGFMSLEMEDVDNYARMVSAESGVDFYKIDRNMIKDEQERVRVISSMSNLSTLPIFFSDAAQVNIHDIRAKADKLKRKHGLDLLIIDYLQLVETESTKNSNREQEISKISRGIKTMAMTSKYPILVLAQLNRDAADKEPELHHLRESGSIEQDADIVMFIHRAKDDTGSMSDEAKLLVRKWRNGAPTELALRFHKETMKFHEPGAFTIQDIPAHKIFQRPFPVSSQDNKPF